MMVWYNSVIYDLGDSLDYRQCTTLLQNGGGFLVCWQIEIDVMEGRGIRLTREDMLKKLATVKFKFIDPPTEWKDIGFTEREIWVNSSGYGYLCCDEPNAWFKGTTSHRDKFESIKKKLECDEFEMEDIEEEVSATLLPDLLETIGYYDDEDCLREVLDGILSLPKEGVKEFYCLNVSDGLFFFDNEEDFRLAYERTDCDYKWEDLDDESLNCWIGRLFPDLERTFRGIIECHDEKHDIYVEINKTIKIKGGYCKCCRMDCVRYNSRLVSK